MNIKNRVNYNIEKVPDGYQSTVSTDTDSKPDKICCFLIMDTKEIQSLHYCPWMMK